MFLGNPLHPVAKALPSATFLLALVSLATAGSPRVNHVYPSGGQVGGEIEVLCTGSNLEDAKTMLFDEPGFEVEMVKYAKPVTPATPRDAGGRPSSGDRKTE